LVVLFGVLVFVSKIFIPTPFDKMAIAVQAILLAMGFLSIGPLGATYVAGVGGVLSAVWRAPFAPFTLLLAFTYGLLMDVLCYAFRVKRSDSSIRKGMLVCAVTLATVVTGLFSYYLTIFVFALLPRNLFVELAILAAGTLNGLVAGFLTPVLWSRVARYLL